jgi:hypothetical protein
VNFFEDSINSEKDDDIKKVVSAVGVIRQKIQNPKDPLTTEEITHIADGGVSTIKVAYKVGTGELDPTEAADHIIDREAAVLGTVVKTACEKVGEKAGTVVGEAIGSIFGPAGAATGAIIGAKVGAFAGKVVGELIIPGIKKVANFCKDVVKAGWEGVKSIANAAWEGVKSIGRGIADLFGW